MLAWNAAITGLRAVQKNHVGTAALGCLAGQGPAACPLKLNTAGNLVALLFILLTPCSAYSADCIPIHEAAQHVGEVKCVMGKVVRVKVGVKGVHFLDFCEDAMSCPFTVVVFGHDLTSKMSATSVALPDAASKSVERSKFTMVVPKSSCIASARLKGARP